MKHLFFICLALLTNLSFAQDKSKEKEKQLTLETAKDFVYEGNELVDADNHIYAEMEYRKAISKAPSVVAGSYNLGNAYYEKGNYDEALYRHLQAAETATSKAEKHKAYHNIGNILMKEEQCKEAVEAYKNALRNDPTDDETRYNFVIAKECAEQQGKQDKEEDKKDEDKEDEKKDEDKKEDDQKKDDPKDEGDQDKKDGEDQNDEGKPKDEKDQGEGDKKDDQKQKGEPKPKPGQLSPQQIKNLLEAMNNQEQKVQQKINADKQKGIKVKPEKDW